MIKSKYYYIFINVILPNLACLFIAMVISSITTMSNIKIWFGEIGLDKVSFIDSYIILCVMFYVVLMFLYIRFIQDMEKELVPISIYGDIPYFIYAFAAVIMRIKTINLKSKPIPLQFKILSNSHIFIIEKLDEIVDANIQYEVKENDFNSRVINLVIADTYSLNNISLPDSVKNNKTYIIERKNKSMQRQRYNSKNLIKLVNKIVEKSKNVYNEYNLFLFTNPETNKSLYYEVFNTCTDNFILNVHSYNKKNNCFSSKAKYTIKN